MVIYTANTRPNFYLRSSRNRVDLLSYESNTTGGLRKIWTRSITLKAEVTPDPSCYDKGHRYYDEKARLYLVWYVCYAHT